MVGERPSRWVSSAIKRVELDVQLLHSPRHPDRPALVAEVALQLADDRRSGERRELEAAFGLEALDRLDEAERCDLDEVVERDAPVGEPPGEMLGETQVGLDQLVANGPLAGAAVVDETFPETIALGLVQSHRQTRFICVWTHPAHRSGAAVRWRRIRSLIGALFAEPDAAVPWIDPVIIDHSAQDLF